MRVFQHLLFDGHSSRTINPNKPMNSKIAPAKGCPVLNENMPITILKMFMNILRYSSQSYSLWQPFSWQHGIASGFTSSLLLRFIASIEMEAAAPMAFASPQQCHIIMKQIPPQIVLTINSIISYLLSKSRQILSQFESKVNKMKQNSTGVHHAY